MKRDAQYPTQIFDGFSTGNPDRDERNDDCDPDFNDYDQLAAELISVQTTLDASATSYLPGTAPANGASYLLDVAANGTTSWLENYLPASVPANGASYLVDVDANGVVSWKENYLPSSAPANGAIYNLDVDANGVVSWVVDANG